MKSWKTHTSTRVLASGKWLAVDDRTVETPDGQVIEHWPWIITPDYVNVLALTEEGKWLVFRQGKYGLQDTSLAPVGGYVEPGEQPLEAARRELREETGYASDDWTHLGRFLVDPNRGVAWGDLFLARGAHPVAEIDADDLEEQELLMLDLPQVEAALRAGKFQVLAWAANIALAILQIKSENGHGSRVL